MIQNKEVIKESIRVHKNMLSKAFNYKDPTLIESAQALGKDISLAISGFKCQSPRCGATQRLQFHHLITTYCRTYMDYWRYVMQRAYWGNIIVLCEDCHTSFHHGMNRAKMDEQLENGNNIYITKARVLS